MATTPRKTAAQKAAEAAERDEYTGKSDPRAEAEAAVAAVEEAAGAEPGKLAPAKPKKETVQQLKNRLRNEAERDVLNAHKAEVVAITQAKYDEHGLQYVRRLTDEEKAAKQIEELYEKFPQLRPAVEEPAEDVEIPDVTGRPYVPADAEYEGFNDDEPPFNG